VDAWQTETIALPFPEGDFVIRFESVTSQNPYLDYLITSSSGVTTTSCVVVTSLLNANQAVSFAGPNPFNERIEVNSTLDKGSYKVIDELGNTVLSGAITRKKFTLEASHLSSGLYLLELKNDGNYLTQKLIKN